MSALPAVITATIASVVAIGAAITASIQWSTRPGKGADIPDLNGLIVTDVVLDLKRYGGVWFEQRRFNSWFESDLDYVTANYAIKSDSGFLSVVNSGTYPDGKISVSEGIARSSKLNGVLMVSFFPFIEGPYVVLYLDTNYTTAIVGSPSRKVLWLLTRNRKVRSAQLNILEKIALSNGYTIAQLQNIVDVKQT
jgi:apolipoprotein D and lipocalin family protein